MCSLVNWLTAARVVGRKRESMCPLANSFAASRAEFPDFTFLSFGYALRRSAHFCHVALFVNRMQYSSLVLGYGAQPHVYSKPLPLGWQKLCEHVLPDKLINSIACILSGCTFPTFGYCPPQESGVEKERVGRCWKWKTSEFALKPRPGRSRR